MGGLLPQALGRSVPCFDGQHSEAPVPGPWRVAALSDGVVPLHGPMTAGNTATLGLCACLEQQGVRVLVSTAKTQMLDLDLFRFLGVEPSTQQVLVVKSSVHFRAAFTPIAQRILVARSPGPMAANPADLPWRHLPAHIDRQP